ncbi:M42 family metallopeptidase [Geomesophilobacter sediminis]|uniref:M42 family metallopeptidase n=1 Tax=Geomesophilobacter sediminis TaxID=2798584 RepID=A0A8J7M464_9BACT|nr:M42 family metallopeptidase [Geomesophilobacter sediminis]MBJ6727743.1 M42 family metallopeptidase [Geomesophilobacter sediminis]
MREASIEFLQQLLQAPSPSGYEQPAQRIFRSYIAPFAQVTSDVMGNVFGFIPGAGDNLPRVMLVGHSDEIGLQVRYVDDNGFIFFGSIGGVDPHITPGMRVNVQAAHGPVKGVVGKKPIHLIEPKERDNVIKLEAQYIDIGAKDKAEALSLIRVGDAITFAVGFERLHGDRVTSRGFDDKAGSFVVAEVLREVAALAQPLAVDLYGVSSVQEEVGLRGGTTSCYSIKPDVGICVEVDFATDQPDVDKKHNGEVGLGKGPILPRGANINPVLFDLLSGAAETDHIPVQYTGIPRATGTDANVMQISRGGVATALVKIPLRYMHTPVETLELADLENCVKLIVATLARITDKNAFIPQ